MSNIHSPSVDLISESNVSGIKASLWRRLAALVYDGVLVFAIWLLVAAVAVAFNAGQALSVWNPFWQSTLFMVTFSFFAYFWRRGGQTLGMRAWRLQLVNERPGGVTLLQCGLRFVGAIGAFLCGFLGYLWILWDPKKMSWHDHLSYTCIVVQP